MPRDESRTESKGGAATVPRVVLAEDHEEIAAQLKGLLSRQFDVVDIVADGWSLVQVVAMRHPDVIVSDIAMPGLSGLAAARAILARQPDARVVFVTVRDDPSVIRAALSLGAVGYVLKCDAGEELIRAVRIILRGTQYASASALDALGPSQPPEF